MAQPTFTIKLYESLHDNTGKTEEVTLSDLAEPLTLGPDEPRESLPLWHGTSFHEGVRDRDDVAAANVLVYDIDGISSAGMAVLLERLDGLRVSYLVHNTFKSRKDTSIRLRVVLPLSTPVDGQTYRDLWSRVAKRLEIVSLVDASKQGAESIFFVPCVVEGLEDERIDVSDFNRPYLDPVSHETQRPNLFSKLQARTLDPIELQLEKVRSCATNKDNTLLSAAVAIGAEYARQGRKLSDVESAKPLLLAALEQNSVSEPVKDWRHALATVEKGLASGYEDSKAELEIVGRAETNYKAYRENRDVLELVEEEGARVRQLDPRLEEKAEAELSKSIKKLRKALEQDPSDTKAIERVAYSLGQYAHVLDEERISKELTLEVKGSDCVLASSDLAVLIATNVAAGKTRPKGKFDDWTARLAKNKDGTGFDGDEANVGLVLTDYPGQEDNISRCVRTGAIRWEKKTFWAPRDASNVQEYESLELAVAIRDVLKTSVKPRIAFERLLAVADSNSRDFFKDYLYECRNKVGITDSYELLERVLIESFGLEDSLYLRRVGAYLLANIVRRTMQPGAIGQHVVVIHGDQGVGKSHFFKSLVCDDTRLFCDNLGDIHSKDSYAKLNRFALVEVAELSDFKKQDANSIKAFITQTGGMVRKPYAREEVELPRRAVLVASSNETNFLPDPTGNRRFWPVMVGSNRLRKAWLDENLDTLWGLAVRWVEEGRSHAFSTEEQATLATPVQDEAAERDISHDDVANVLYGPMNKNKWRAYNPKDSSQETLVPLSSLDPDVLVVRALDGQWVNGRLRFIRLVQVLHLLDLDRREQYRVAGELTRLGWARCRMRMSDGTRPEVWALKE